MQNILLILISVTLNCSAQLLIKKGMTIIGEISGTASSLVSALPQMAANIYLWIAMMCYGLSILLWMVVLSKVDVSFAYPFLSIGYIISAVVGYYFFNESVTIIRVLGIAVICFGVILVSRS